tara:strand:+ start:47 stop:250 length:204 start_codon:yes stop_codon:yes gene_type:complete
MNEITATELALIGIRQRGEDMSKAFEDSDILYDLMKEEKQMPVIIDRFTHCNSDCMERGLFVCHCNG